MRGLGEMPQAPLLSSSSMEAEGRTTSDTRSTPADEPHEIIKLAVAVIDVAPVGKGWIFSEPARARVASALEKLFDSPDLRPAVLSLVSLAKHFDDRGHRAVAAGLLEVATTATMSLGTQGSEAAQLAHELGAMTTEVFASFRDEDVAKAAPVVRSEKYGRTAEPGTISVSSLSSLGRRRA